MGWRKICPNPVAVAASHQSLCFSVRGVKRLSIVLSVAKENSGSHTKYCVLPFISCLLKVLKKKLCLAVIFCRPSAVSWLDLLEKDVR